MRKLVLLEKDGKLFESIYYLATSIANPEAAAKLFEKHESRADPRKRYWQSAFDELGGTENVLVSAIVNTLDMPFCAYVLVARAPDRLEISPWLLSGKVDAEALKNEVMADDLDGDALMSYARMFSLTADFLSWLDKRENKARKKVDERR